MTGTGDEARKPVWVHRYHITKGKTHTEERKEANEVVDTEVGSGTEQYEMSVVKARTFEDDGVLIGIARTTKEGQLSHIWFPKILSVDVTYGDNNEKASLHSCH